MTELWIKITPTMQPTIVAEGGEDDITLEQMQEAVGGYIEYCTFAPNTPFPVPNKDGNMVIGSVINVVANEEGALMGLKANTLGTYAANGTLETTRVIVGDVLVHVRIGEDAEVVDKGAIIRLIHGKAHITHMMPSHLEEADYGEEE